MQEREREREQERGSESACFAFWLADRGVRQCRRWPATHHHTRSLPCNAAPVSHPTQGHDQLQSEGKVGVPRQLSHPLDNYQDPQPLKVGIAANASVPGRAGQLARQPLPCAPWIKTPHSWTAPQVGENHGHFLKGDQPTPSCLLVSENVARLSAYH